MTRTDRLIQKLSGNLSRTMSPGRSTLGIESSQAEIARDPVVLADLPPLLTVKEVARIVRRSESGTYAWLRGGGLKHIRIEGSIRVLKMDLESFLSARPSHGTKSGSTKGEEGRTPR